MAIFDYPTNVSNMSSLFSYANTVTEGWFGAVILFVILVVAFLSLKQYSTHRALAASTFLVSIIAIIFKIMNLISIQVLIASMILLIVSVAWLWFAEKHEY